MSDHIPHEVMTNILRRLSFKDLVRCRRVSKQWRQTIDNPRFIDAQISWFLTAEWNAALFLQKENGPLLYWIQENAVANAEEFFSSSRQNHLENKVLLMGSCRGLVCISLFNDDDSQHDIVVFNPSTGDRHTFNSVKTDGAPRPLAYGFGYDELTNDYKVVRIVKLDSDVCTVEIYSVRSKSISRRDHEGIGKWRDHQQMGVFVGGALHWCVVDSNTSKSVILALDLGCEKFRQIPQPVYPFHQNMWEVKSVGVVRSCLCICSQHSFMFEIEIWSMNQYGDLDSWDLIFAIVDRVPPFFRLVGTGDFFRTMLMVNGFQLVWCNHEKDRLEPTRMRVDQGFYQAVFCLRSLAKVFPNHEDEKDDRDDQVKRKEHEMKLAEQEEGWKTRPVVVDKPDDLVPYFCRAFHQIIDGGFD